MVCQGLQSCLEPGFLESRALIDKLANVSHSQSNNINPIFSSSHQNPIISNLNDQENNLLCWSFLQQSTQVEAKTEEVYVHPLAKRSSSTLSTQSLEMCTEGLGSETGSNNVNNQEMIVSADFSSCETQYSCNYSNNNTRRRGTRGGRIERGSRGRDYSASFPPPLTQIRGTDGIQLSPHREEGRLVLKAVPFSHKSCFRAERSDGRLRLFSLSKDDDNVSFEDDDGGEDEEEKCIRDCGKKMECEIDQNNEEFARLSSRCKEEGPRNNRGLNWEPVWVAIS